MIWQIIFFLSIFFIGHSYILYPVILQLLAKNKKQNALTYSITDSNLPYVTVVFAAYNEEKVIAQKIESTLNTNYPLEKIRIFIGSDSSTDQTNKIISLIEKEYQQLKLKVFQSRTGKAGIINQLVEETQTEIIILTDANVIFTENTILNLVKHFKNNEIVIVGGQIVNSHFNEHGISFQEESYISRENRIKYQEGLIWGSMAGAFGGCYAIRKNWYSPVPPRFFMDDFYITMNVFEKGGKAILEPTALCYEDVSNKLSEEFRRKVRISIGNFQNLYRYKGLVFSNKKGVAFSFISHKILRWFGPFFLILIFFSNILVYHSSVFFQITMYFQLLLMVTPLIDTLLLTIKVNINLLRFITHFYSMNLALLIGFIKYLKGVKSNIWQPTQRFQ